MSFKRVLIAIDDSPIAARAADVGIELARSLKAALAFVSVVDPMQGLAPESGYSASELYAAAAREAKALVDRFTSRVGSELPGLGFVSIGRPAHEIVKTAIEWPADVIVIGSHGRGGVRRALLGSIAEGVVRHATCPVLVVRAPE